MPKIEYLDPEIANEGERADATFAVPLRPHVWDYAQLKEHPHYGKYFAPKPFSPWPAWIYNHKTGESKIVRDGKEALEYGVGFNKSLRHPDYEWTGDWQAEPPKGQKPNIHDTGKSVVGVTAASATAESMAKILQTLTAGKSADATPEIATAIAEDKDYQDYLAFKRMQAATRAEPDAVAKIAETAELSEAEQKTILIDVAKENGIKADKRWSIDRIKDELDKVKVA